MERIGMRIESSISVLIFELWQLDISDLSWGDVYYTHILLFNAASLHRSLTMIQYSKSFKQVDLCNAYTKSCSCGQPAA